MDFSIDKTTRELLEKARERGRTEVRPVGLEADRLGRPIPVDHPYFESYVEKGGGRTNWPGPDAKPLKLPPGVIVRTLLLAEEWAY